MKLVYCDESGDTGKFPDKSQNQIFIYSLVYLQAENWSDTFYKIFKFRQELRKKYNLPSRMEFHTRNFILNKNPYHALNLTEQVRLNIVKEYIQLIKKLSANNEVQCINVAIIKSRISSQKKYSVLENSVKFGLQRIDNNINKNPSKYKNFMMITDEGCYLPLRKIVRKLVRMNYVPYKKSNSSRQIKLTSLLDDPLQKNSKDSYFIQLADFIAYMLSQYIDIKLKLFQHPKRQRIIKDEEILKLVDEMKDVFNTAACPNSELGYGVVVHPYNKKDD